MDSTVIIGIYNKATLFYRSKKRGNCKKKLARIYNNKTKWILGSLYK